MSSNGNTSPKSTGSAKSLGERLANVAEKHKKKNVRSNLMAKLNKARAEGTIGRSVSPTYGNYFYQNVDKAQCETAPKPPSMIKNNRGIFVKNPEYALWEKKCQAGGKRKTRKSKKSKRITRRRR